MDRIGVTKVITMVIDKTTTGFEADCLFGDLEKIDDWLIDWAWVWHGINIVHHSNAEGKVMVIVYGFD